MADRGRTGKETGDRNSWVLSTSETYGICHADSVSTITLNSVTIAAHRRVKYYSAAIYPPESCRY